jgi:hypothetical protein
VKTTKARIFVVVISGIAFCGLGYFLCRFWVWPLSAGAVLIAWSWIAPQKTGLLVADRKDLGGSGMILPAVWNEKEVGLGFTRYQHSPNMLSSYVNGIVSRFVVGQDMRTVQTRIAFLEQFNKFSEVARESYKWQRHLNGGRAKAEEDTEDAKAQLNLQQAHSELELLELDTDIKRHEKLLQIERLKREIADLNKPAASPPPPPPKPPPPPPAPSAAEVRKQNLRDLEERERRVIEEMRLTGANPSLSEDQRRRKLNALEDTLAQIHEEQARLL